MATREEVRQGAYVPSFNSRSQGEDLDVAVHSTENLDSFMPGSQELIDDEELFALSARSAHPKDRDAFADNSPHRRENVDNGGAEVEEEELNVINDIPSANDEKLVDIDAMSQQEEWWSQGEFMDRREFDDQEEPKEAVRDLKSPNGQSGFPYRHEVAIPKFSVGSKKLSISEAQLFGLLDKSGNLQVQAACPSRDSRGIRQHVEKLSLPRSSILFEPNDEEKRNLTFQPKRSAEALAAMKNKRCGYDFMDRLDNRGDFLDRIAPDPSKAKKLPKSEMDALQADYEARLDKLQCPRCLRPQSFDEFFEKRRTCTLCSVKFEKLHVTSGAGFLKKMQQREDHRQERLKEVEMEMYGSLMRGSKTGDKHCSAIARSNGQEGAKSLSLPLIKVEKKSKLRSASPSTLPKAIVDDFVSKPPVMAEHGDQSLPVAPPRRPTSAKGTTTRGISVSAKGAETILRIRKTEQGVLNDALLRVQQQTGGVRGKPPKPSGGREGEADSEIGGLEAKMQKLVQM